MILAEERKIEEGFRERELERFMKENQEYVGELSSKQEVIDFINVKLDKYEDVMKRTEEEKCIIV